MGVKETGIDKTFYFPQESKNDASQSFIEQRCQ